MNKIVNIRLNMPIWKNKSRNICKMTQHQIEQEIIRVKKAISKSTSKHLKNDYGKYLKRLERKLNGTIRH